MKPPKSKKKYMHSNHLGIICILLLVTLSLIEMVPFLMTFLFPKLCYGCTDIGKLQQYLNNKLNLSYISWASYTCLIIYLIYLSSQLKHAMKYILIFFCILMIYIPTVPILIWIDMLLWVIFKNPPFIHDYHKVFPPSIEIENNSTTIINEFKKYTEINTPECIRKTNPGFKIENNSDDDNCWRALYLKKIGKIDNNMIQYFPNTIALLKDNHIHNAFFSILDPGVEITPHHGYYKGYLRYHLGVIIPNGDEKAYIVCGGEKYVWEQNKGIMFDDMYTHYVKNPTNKIRVVLYIDVKRESNYLINKINDTGIYLIENSFFLNMFLKNQHKQNKLE